MNVGEMILMLQKADPSAEVKAFDPNSGQLESVTGMLYAGADKVVELCTDDPND